MYLIELCSFEIERLQLLTITTILVLFMAYMMHLAYQVITGRDQPSNLFFTMQQQQQTEKMGMIVPPANTQQWQKFFDKQGWDRFEIKVINEHVATITVDVPLHQVHEFVAHMKKTGAVGVRAE